MKPSESVLTPTTACESAPGAPRPGSAASCAPVDPTQLHQVKLARARELGRQLQLQVVIDESGWLGRGVEILYMRARDNTLQPITVRVGLEAQDEDVLADGGPLALFQRYNAALDQLRQLAQRFTTAVRARHVTVEPESELEVVNEQLNALEDTIGARQALHMGARTVRLLRLKNEIEFFESLHTYLSWIVSTEVATPDE